MNLVQNILDPDVDALTGLVVDVVKQTGSDAGVQRFYETDYDEIGKTHVKWNDILFCGYCL